MPVLAAILCIFLRLIGLKGYIIYSPLVLAAAYLFFSAKMMVSGGTDDPSNRRREPEFHRTLEPRQEYIPTFRWQRRPGTAGESNRPGTAASTSSSINRSAHSLNSSSVDVTGAEDVRVDVPAPAGRPATASNAAAGGASSNVAQANADGLRRRISSSSTSIATTARPATADGSRARGIGGETSAQADPQQNGPALQLNTGGARPVYLGRTADRIARIKARKAARDAARQGDGGSEGTGTTGTRGEAGEGQEGGSTGGSPERASKATAWQEAPMASGTRQPGIKPYIPHRDKLSQAAMRSMNGSVTMASLGMAGDDLGEEHAMGAAVVGAVHGRIAGPGSGGSSGGLASISEHAAEYFDALTGGGGGGRVTLMARPRTSAGLPALEVDGVQVASSVHHTGRSLGSRSAAASAGVTGVTAGVGSGTANGHAERAPGERRRTGKKGSIEEGVISIERVTSIASSPGAPSSSAGSGTVTGGVAWSSHTPGRTIAAVARQGGQIKTRAIIAGQTIVGSPSHHSPSLSSPSELLPGAVHSSPAPLPLPVPVPGPSSSPVPIRTVEGDIGPLLQSLNMPQESYLPLLQREALADVRLLRGMAQADPGHLREVLRGAGIEKVGHREALVLALQQPLDWQ